MNYSVWLSGTSSTILGGPRFQEGTRSAKDKLERHGQERSAMNGTYLGRGGGGSSQQIRMASEFGPIRSRGRGMNQVKSSQVWHRHCHIQHVMHQHRTASSRLHYERHVSDIIATGGSALFRCFAMCYNSNHTGTELPAKFTASLVHSAQRPLDVSLDIFHLLKCKDWKTLNRY